MEKLSWKEAPDYIGWMVKWVSTIGDEWYKVILGEDEYHYWGGNSGVTEKDALLDVHACKDKVLKGKWRNCAIDKASIAEIIPLYKVEFTEKLSWSVKVQTPDELKGWLIRDLDDDGSGLEYCVVTRVEQGYMAWSIWGKWCVTEEEAVDWVRQFGTDFKAGEDLRIVVSLKTFQSTIIPLYKVF